MILIKMNTRRLYTQGGYITYLAMGAGLLMIGGIAFLTQKNIEPTVINLSDEIISENTENENPDQNILDVFVKKEIELRTPRPIPDTVQAIYMSSWVAATPSLRAKLVDFIDTTELNSVIIDIKDSTGRVSFMPQDPYLIELGASDNRVKDMREFLEMLHEKDIYVIGRISVFQDPYIVQKKPEWAVQSKKGGIWKDRKGLAFLSVDNEQVWDYTLRIALDSYEIGFDEINFDYIRYPSDGPIADIEYNLAEGEVRAEKLEKFFMFLDEKLRKEKSIPISADLFGMVTSNTDDLGIGQVLERAVPYFDAIAPMVYPSHYPTGFLGYTKPAEHPYEVIFYAMDSASKRVTAMGYDPNKILRPWFQDFNLGTVYTKEKIQEQIDANKAVGLSSWMMWDPSNKYNATKPFMQYGL
jgi:hypothetical protein